MVLGAVAQCLETVIASSNLGSCTEGLGHYGLGTAPYLPYFQYKPVRAAEWIHRGQFLFASRLSFHILALWVKLFLLLIFSLIYKNSHNIFLPLQYTNCSLISS